MHFSGPGVPAPLALTNAVAVGSMHVQYRAERCSNLINNFSRRGPFAVWPAGASSIICAVHVKLRRLFLTSIPSPRPLSAYNSSLWLSSSHSHILGSRLGWYGDSPTFPTCCSAIPPLFYLPPIALSLFWSCAHVWRILITRAELQVPLTASVCSESIRSSISMEWTWLVHAFPAFMIADHCFMDGPPVRASSKHGRLRAVCAPTFPCRQTVDETISYPPWNDQLVIWAIFCLSPSPSWNINLWNKSFWPLLDFLSPNAVCIPALLQFFPPLQWTIYSRRMAINEDIAPSVSWNHQVAF